jgi:hypothetical protein
MSSVALPPETPIEIDGGIAYNYVIAQQGEISITVDSDTDFTFVLTAGEPAVLRLKYIGTILTTSQYKTVTIRLTLPSSLEQTHQIQLKILGTSATQRIPNITTVQSRVAAPNQSIVIAIKTDIAVTSYGASNLPGGLSVNTVSGLITGTVPTTPEFRIITLRAINEAHHYYRYFVLTVGNTGSSSFPSGRSFSRSSIIYVNSFYDGDFTVAQISGVPKSLFRSPPIQSHMCIA